VEGVLLVVGLVVLLDALFGERGLVEGFRSDQEVQAATASLARMRAESARLKEENQRLRDEDPATIEDAARRDHGMIKRGEKVFTIRDVKPAGQ